MSIEISTLSADDWESVKAIYLEGIQTGQATFETEAPDWSSWDKAHLKIARLVAREGNEVIGWAALSPVSARRVYAGVAEVSVYVAAGARVRGIGRQLLTALISEAERSGVWTLQAGIFPENESSIALHEACGFRKVGRRERIGKLGDVWRDVILMERRSQIVGVP
jgi:L-amino acid N-acyltransferase YncA